MSAVVPILLLSTAACALAPPPRAVLTSECQEVPSGSPEAWRTPVGQASGPRIDAPRLCPGKGSRHGAYIRVHGQGWRRLVFGRAACMELPEDGTSCPEIELGTFGHAAMKAIHARLGEAAADSVGLGACGTLGDYDAWNPSLHVHDWSHADLAIAIVDEHLRRYQIGNHFGVSVSGFSCGVLLEGGR